LVTPVVIVPWFVMADDQAPPSMRMRCVVPLVN
jgi:hypothetical protein